MTTIGNSNTPINLSPSAPNVTFTGDINAYGALGTTQTYGANGQLGTVILDGAVIGFGPTKFNIVNDGVLQSGGQSVTDVALILTAPGIVHNAGTIAAGSGLVMASKAAGGYIRNTGLIDARAGGAVYLDGPGGLSNAGDIFAATTGVYLTSGGNVANTGSIAGAYGVSATYNATNLYNAGHITGTTIGVALDGTIVNAPGGIIAGGTTAISLTTGGIYNRGQISGNGGYGIDIGNGAQLRNTGTIHGRLAAIQGTQSAGITTTLYNAASGRITGSYHAVLLSGASGGYANIANGGYIEGGVSASLIEDSQFFDLANIAIGMQAGRLLNTGTINGNVGVVVATGPGTIINDGLIESQGFAGRSDLIGIDLHGGGQITNSGNIIGAVEFYADGALSNTGVIIGGVRSFPSAAVNVFNGGYLTSAFLYAGSFIGNAGTIGRGVQLDGGGNVVNTGTIADFSAVSDISGYYGIYLLNPGTITNTGLIEGTDAGIEARTGATVYDSGTIAGLTGLGGREALSFGAGHANRLVLAATADIIGGVGLNGALELQAGAAAKTPATLNIGAIGEMSILTIDPGAIWDLSGAADKNAIVLNAGTLLANNTHTALTAKGKVYNGGLIKGGSGISDAGGYVENAGRVIAGGKTGTGIALTAPGTIVNTAGATITGAIGVALTTQSSLYNYGLISGGISAAAATYIYNAGTILARPGETLSLRGSLAGPGTVVLSTGLAALDGAVAAQTIAFSATAETLALGDPKKFAGTIANFAAGDTIDLTGLTLAGVTGDTFAAGTLTLKTSGATYRVTFANQAFGGETFSLFADGTGTGITLSSTMPAMAFLTPTTTPAPAAATLPAYTAAPRPAAAPPVPQTSLTTTPAGWLSHLATSPVSPFPPTTL